MDKCAMVNHLDRYQTKLLAYILHTNKLLTKKKHFIEDKSLNLKFNAG